MTFWRSSVTVTPAMTMSLLPLWVASRAASKSMSSTCSSRPSFSAMAPATSMSIPSRSPLSVVISYGGKAALVDIVSLPALTVVTSPAASSVVSSEAASLVSSEEAASLEAASEEAAEEAEPPQAARLSTIAVPIKRAVSFFMVYSLESYSINSQALTWYAYSIVA